MVGEEDFFEQINQEKTDIDQFKCQGCGANLTYDPNTKKLVCAHCGYSQDINTDTNVRERDFSELAVHNFEEADKVQVVKCDNCGATEILKNNEVATNCPFCGSPLVIEKEKIDSVKPDSMIPFLFDAKKAKEYCNKWLRSRWFANGTFKKQLRLTQPNGVYYPVWTFDSETFTTYKGRLGKRYTTTHRDSKGNLRTETHIRWFNVNGTRKNFFDDIVVNASSFVEEKTLNKLQPYPQTNYVVYSTEFLAGYVANHYTIDPYTAFKTAEEKMSAAIRQEIVNSYHADVVDYLNMSITHTNKTFKSMFLPIYMTGTTFKEKKYNQYINGATGKITGNYPKSVFKIILVVLLGLAVAAGLAYLYLRYGNY